MSLLLSLLYRFNETVVSRFVWSCEITGWFSFGTTSFEAEYADWMLREY